MDPNYDPNSPYYAFDLGPVPPPAYQPTPASEPDIGQMRIAADELQRMSDEALDGAKSFVLEMPGKEHLPYTSRERLFAAYVAVCNGERVKVVASALGGGDITLPVTCRATTPGGCFAAIATTIALALSTLEQAR